MLRILSGEEKDLQLLLGGSQEEDGQQKSDPCASPWCCLDKSAVCVCPVLGLAFVRTGRRTDGAMNQSKERSGVWVGYGWVGFVIRLDTWKQSTKAPRPTKKVQTWDNAVMVFDALLH